MKLSNLLLPNIRKHPALTTLVPSITTLVPNNQIQKPGSHTGNVQKSRPHTGKDQDIPNQSHTGEDQDNVKAEPTIGIFMKQSRVRRSQLIRRLSPVRERRLL